MKIIEELDLHAECVKNSAATFFVRCAGESMTGAGIFPDDILVIDKSLEAKENSVVLAIVDGEFTVKKMVYNNDSIVLMPENPAFKPIHVYEGMEFYIWGVVTTVIHSFMGASSP